MFSARDSQSKHSRAYQFFSGARSFADDLWMVVSRTCVAALALLLIVSLKPLIFDRNFVIGEFVVPDEMKASGLTSSVIARLLYERVARIQRIAKAAVAEQYFDAQPFESHEMRAKLADIKILGAEVNLATLVTQVRALLGITDTQIVGEVALGSREPGKTNYVIRAQASGSSAWTKQPDANPNLYNLLDEIAKSLVEEFDPLSAGFYYLHDSDERKTNLDRAIWLADKFQIRNDPRYVWALLLRGMAWREKQNNDGRTRAAFCEAITQDPSFTPAWRQLAMALRFNGQIAEAHDLALRLVKRPNEIEGWRQLGALQSGCAGGEEQDLKAKEYFEWAITLGASRDSKGHYLTLVDYARWLYNRFQADKLYAFGEPQAKLLKKANYLDAASEYLSRAQALAPEQESIYTMYARVLGHPREDGNKSVPAIEGRYLMAEMKARFALAQDERKPFANFVMGELLTDAGMEVHKYMNSNKFVEAEKYLTKSRAAAVFPELKYEAMYARARAGQGEFTDALGILSKLESRKHQSEFYLVDWVHGEVLYNQSLKTQDKTSMNQALEYLARARQVHFCGPRSDAIMSLMETIEHDLGVKVAKLNTGLSTAAIPRPKPACGAWGWEELKEDELLPWGVFDPAATAFLPTFDAAH